MDGEYKSGTLNSITKLLMDRHETHGQGQEFGSDSSVTCAPKWIV